MWRVVERDLRDEAEVRRAAHQSRRTRDGLRWTSQARDRRRERLKRRVGGRCGRSGITCAACAAAVGERRILVDFAAATTALQAPLRALTKALGDVPDVPNDDRARVALALGFFQEIPYATLEDKQRQGGDFLPAPALLAQNRGDCDSKAVALAAVLRTFTRFRKLAVVTMPDHAILVVEMPAQAGDTTVAPGRPAVCGAGARGTGTGADRPGRALHREVPRRARP